MAYPEAISVGCRSVSQARVERGAGEDVCQCLILCRGVVIRSRIVGKVLSHAHWPLGEGVHILGSVCTHPEIL